MSMSFFIVALVFAVGAGVLLVLAFRERKERRSSDGDALKVLDSAPRHLCNMPPIRQAMDPADFRYLLDRGGQELAKRIRRERRKVALLYLAAIHRDFEQLLRIARVLALLSPEVSGEYEYQRLRFSLIFRLRFQMVRLRFLAGHLAMPEVGKLGEIVTSLAVHMEASLTSLGERAALAAELALESDR